MALPLNSAMPLPRYRLPPFGKRSSELPDIEKNVAVVLFPCVQSNVVVWLLAEFIISTLPPVMENRL